MTRAVYIGIEQDKYDWWHQIQYLVYLYKNMYWGTPIVDISMNVLVVGIKCSLGSWNLSDWSYWFGSNKGHFTHEPRVVTMELWEPKRKYTKAVQHTSKIMSCGHGSSSVVWSHMWPGPQPNAISMNFYLCGSSRMIKYNKSKVMSILSAMVSRFCVRPTSKSWFLKIIQGTMKHDAFNVM